MNTKPHQDAVDDLLDFCRDYGHGLTVGRSLGPILLGQSWQNEDDDERLMTALEQFLAEAIKARQSELDMPAMAPNLSAAQRLAEVREQNDQVLLHLYLVQLYFMERFDTARLAAWCKLGGRSIQAKIKDGRGMITKLVARHRVIAHSAEPPRSSEESTAGNDVQTKPSPMPGTQTPPQSSHSQRDTVHIKGQNVQSVSGTVSGSVFQHHTQHIYHGTASGSSRSTPAQGEDGATLLICLALLAGGYWLLRTTPWLSIGTLLAICVWRGLRHSVTAWRWFGEESDPDERWWQAGYAALWLGTIIWALILAGRMWLSRQAFGDPIAQLWTVVWFVALAGQLCLLGIIDIYLAVLRTPDLRWPLRLLVGRAMWFWSQRWLMLFVACLPFLVVLLTIVLARLSGM